MEKISLDRMGLLHPKLIPVATTALLRANAVLTSRSQVRVAQGFRTPAEQHQLFLQRPKVTNADSWQSIHNYGLALDIVLIIDGKEASWDTKKDWDGDKQSDWMEVVKVFKDFGFQWGGDWRTFKDMPHFEMTFGLTLAQLQAKVKAKDFIKGTQFINI